MGIAYQVFNPQIGQHFKFLTEEEAKTAVLEIVKQLIASWPLTVNQETILENGDVTWTPVDFVSQLKITI